MGEGNLYRLLDMCLMIVMSDEEEKSKKREIGGERKMKKE